MNGLFTYILFIVPSLMCLVAAVILELPESYYSILRIVVFVCAISVGYLFWHHNNKTLAIYPYILIAIVFNPATGLFPSLYESIPQPAWIVADVIGVIVFLGGLWLYKKEEKPA